MKIERIGDNALRVTISINDLEERNIDVNAFNNNSPAAQEFLWDLTEQAVSQSGFNVTDSQLAIEYITDSNDSFIVTITKLESDNDFESFHKFIKNRFKRTDLRVKKKNRKVCSTVVIYSFNNFDDLCNLSSRIAPVYTGDSFLYKLNDVYYLMLTRNSFNVPNTRTFELVIGEYGYKVPNANFYEGYLNEYGNLIIDSNALEVLNNYF